MQEVTAEQTRAAAAQKQRAYYESLQAMQLAGTAPMIAANKNDAYEIPQAEVNYLHLIVRHEVHVPAERTYKTFEKKLALDPKDFENMEKEGAFAGYDSHEIIHDPR